MRYRSDKMEARYVERRPLVAETLRSHDGGVPCARCHSARAVDPHEPLSRARGGSITDARNVVPLCRRCHTWVTEHPERAEAEGWSEPSQSARHDFGGDEFLCTLCGHDRLSWRHR